MPRTRDDLLSIPLAAMVTSITELVRADNIFGEGTYERT